MLVTACVLANSEVAYSQPAPPARRLPGVTKGEVRTWWLAPYVRVTEERIAKRWTIDVRWFDSEGNVVREVSGRNVSAHSGYVSALADGKNTIYAVNGDWKFVLPKKSGRPGYITATRDSRTFLHEFHPREGQIAVDVYFRGKLVKTIGPFQQHRGESVQLSADGSMALLAWKGAEKKSMQVVVVGPGAKVCSQIDCTDSGYSALHSPIAAPEATAVLLRPNVGGDAANTFLFYRESGKRSSFDVPNGTFVAWGSRTNTALFSTGGGENEHFQLIDCTSGKPIWSIADPNPPHPGFCCAAVIAGDYVLFHGRDFAAVDRTNGRLVARWKPTRPRRPIGINAGWFRKIGSRLFVISDDEFTEFSLEDISHKKNGWK